jgi:hypothetical protein
MEKVKILLLLLVTTVNAISQSNWLTSPITVGAIESKIGSRDSRSLNFVTNNKTGMVLDSLGNLSITGKIVASSLSGSGFRLLKVDDYGNIGPADAPVGGNPVSTPCVANSLPWYEGGNTAIGTNNNIIGPCNTRDFILQSNNTSLVFLKTSGLVGLGPGNSSPSSQLDVTDGGGNHLLIGGDVLGQIESTSEMNLICASANDIHFREGAITNSPNFSIKGGGNVGIGTSSPGTKLTIASGSSDGVQNRTSSTSAKAFSSYNTSTSQDDFLVYGDGKTILGYQSGSPNAAMLNINTNGSSTKVLSSYNSSTSQEEFLVLGNGKTILGYQSGSPNGAMLDINTNGGEAIHVFNTASTNTITKVTFKVESNGRTNIGESRPLTTGVASNAMLSVDGLILARDIRVSISTSTHWADYVFDKKYQLMSLEDVERYVLKNRHLPEVPSESDVKENGIDVTSMNLILLKKVEELYLYTIELKRNIELQDAQIEQLSKKLNKTGR